MDHRELPFTVSRPQALGTLPQADREPLATTALALAPLTTTGPRPLSDIRELSEPSIADHTHQRALNHLYPRLNKARSASLGQKQPLNRVGSARSQLSADNAARHAQPSRRTQQKPKCEENGSSSYSSTPERSSFYSIPHSSVPRRTSSHGHPQQKTTVRKPCVHEAPPPSRPKYQEEVVPNHGSSRSPVKATSTAHDAVRSDRSRRVPSRTCVRKTQGDIPEAPVYKHPRVKLELQVSAPLFVGGGSVEGQVKVIVDENERVRARRSLGIGALAVDLVGFEDVSGGRKASFLAIGTDLIDDNHPPPADMIEPPHPLMLRDDFWTLMPSTSHLAFMVSLPLEPGPPPFQSKHANIRYLLCATALISDAGKQYRVRVSQEVHVLPTYDPDKALTSLPSPLTASDELRLTHNGWRQTVKLTAGVHRQVWVSGGSIFVDVHVANKSHKPVKSLELSLEQNILCYKHAAASTREKSVSAARIFEKNEQNLMIRRVLKPGDQSWTAIDKHSSETRTYELEVPRGLATVHCGKYFEVRFFLNVSVSLGNSKLVSVQLPMILIHINSLDVLPNSVDQVAAAIEEKKASKHHRPRETRSGKHSRSHSRQRSATSPSDHARSRQPAAYGPGRAFSAPVEQAIDRQHAVRADIRDLGKTLNHSPRKQKPPHMHAMAIKKVGSNVSVHGIGSSGGSKFVVGGPPSSSEPDPPRTPVFATQEHGYDGADNGDNRDGLHTALRSGVRRMQSFRSTGSKRSLFSSSKREHQPQHLPHHAEPRSEESRPPKHNFTVVTNANANNAINHQRPLEPHTLGLTSSSSFQPSASRHHVTAANGSHEPMRRPGTSQSTTTREKLDRSRFEFKGVRRKGTSGSLKEKGRQLWGQMRDRREGWI